MASGPAPVGHLRTREELAAHERRGTPQTPCRACQHLTWDLQTPDLEVTRSCCSHVTRRRSLAKSRQRPRAPVLPGPLLTGASADTGRSLQRHFILLRAERREGRHRRFCWGLSGCREDEGKAHVDRAARSLDLQHLQDEAAQRQWAWPRARALRRGRPSTLKSGCSFESPSEGL